MATFECGICPNPHPRFPSLNVMDEHCEHAHPEECIEHDEPEPREPDMWDEAYDRELEAAALGRPLFPNEY